jgi:hypothetical protein
VARVRAAIAPVQAEVRALAAAEATRKLAPAAAQRAPAQTVPAAALRALLGELDAWPERPTNFGDASDRLSALTAAHAGEAPEPEAE